MTKGDHVYEDKINVVLDPRSPFTVADRKAQYDATMRVHAMFGRMSDLVARIQCRARPARRRRPSLPGDDPLHTQLLALADKADVIRKQIVATKEGGAITGEERLREHMDQLYGGLMSYEGKPSATLRRLHRRAGTRTRRRRRRPSASSRTATWPRPTPPSRPRACRRSTCRIMPRWRGAIPAIPIHGRRRNATDTRQRSDKRGCFGSPFF